MDNPRFLIKKVIINNFRGYSYGTFEFFKDKDEKRGLILLGGPNGYGKTSLLDAVEWCLSGTIRRIQEDYEIRKETSNTLQRGLIRHNPSKKDVSVFIEADIQGNIITLERIFDKNQESAAFSLDSTTLKVNGEISQFSTIDGILNKGIASIFYDRYVCSYDKNIKIYEQSRDGIYQMFSAFFGGTQEIENIINNLQGYQTGSGKQKKLVYGVIKQLEEELGILNVKKEEASQRLGQEEEKRSSYLDDIKSQGDLQEFLDIYSANMAIKLNLHPQKIMDQSLDYEQKLKAVSLNKRVLEKIKYLVDKRIAYIQGELYIEHLQKEAALLDFREEVLNPYKQYEAVIDQIKSLNVEELKERLDWFKRFKMHVSQINGTSQGINEVLLGYAKKLFDDKHILVKQSEALESKAQEKVEIEEALKKYDTTKPVLKALRALVDNTGGFGALRKSKYPKCPLCGSKEAFSDEDIELAQDAKRILGEVDNKRSELQVKNNLLETDLKEQQEYIKERIIEYIDNEIPQLQKSIFYFNQTETLRIACIKFNLQFKDLDISFLEKMESELKEKLLEESTVLIMEDAIINTLSNQSNKLEGIPSILNVNENMEIKEFSNLPIKRKQSVLREFVSRYKVELDDQKSYLDSSTIEEISVEMLEIQLNTWKHVEQFLISDEIIKDMDRNVLNLKDDFEEKERLSKNKDEEIKKLKSLLSNLRTIRSEWDKKVADEIRVPFKRMYKRLTRHTNINDIDLIKDGRTTQKAKIVANVNSEEIFAPNILSAGQLSTMSLAIFLTVAMGQKSQAFRCYFMDEPIQTMDDLNILSFVDLLRTEFLRHKTEQDSFVDQLILTTCDEDFENLVHHKMKNFDVNFTHIRFTGYGEYEFKV